jgi:hypothetical protein
MDAQRRAFLDTVVSDLATSPSRGSDTDSRTARSRRSTGFAITRAVAGTLLVGASFLAFSATSAQAERPALAGTSVVIQDGDCFTPDPVSYDHTKTCPNQYTFMAYDYLYGYKVHDHLWCYVFDAWYYGCGGSDYIGQKTRCFYV